MQQIENEAKSALEGTIQTPNLRKKVFRTHEALCNYVKSFKIVVYNVSPMQCSNTIELTYEDNK